LGTAGYLIHGTDKPFGIGMRVTHGCLRMYPEDIEALFDKVAVGTPVQLLNQPIKIGWLADSLFIELHPPLDEDEAEYVDYGQNFKEHFYDLKGQGIEDSTHTQFKKGEYIKLLNYLDSQGWTKDSQREGELGDVKINIILFKRK
jgi:hypothetical protein